MSCAPKLGSSADTLLLLLARGGGLLRIGFAELLLNIISIHVARLRVFAARRAQIEKAA